MALKQVWQRWTSRYFSDEQAVILLVLLIVGFATVLWLGRMLAPFLTALVLAFLLQGAVTRLTRRGMSHLTAVITVFVVFIGLLLKVVLLLIPLVWSQLTALVQEIPYIVGQGQELLGQLETRFPNLVSPEQMQAWTAMAGREATQLGQRLLALSLASLGNVMALIIYLVLVPILVFFLLKDRAVLLGFFLPFLPEKRTLMSQVWAEMEVQLSNYVRGKALEILIVSTVSYATFALFGLPYALLLGILVGLSTLLPYIGAAVVTLPVAAVAGFHFGLTQPFLYVILAYGVIQALDGNVLAPLLFAEAVNLHPVTIIVAVLFFGGIWGFWGLFFSIPLATLVKALWLAWPRQETRRLT
ncbi:AI-2E family transporter [Halomonas daqingensis]|uniref:AI-2E family transporter n=1 Tax=Billgrantia desiderata TaxID=52021 RepID=A0AAW4YWQ0_9GAMM|nr:AI-2E family transporter [Halomonas desiderata]